MYGIFTYIWLIFMVTVGKYTVRPMDPMGHVSLVRFGYTYSTFLCVAFFVETATLWQKQINSRSVIIIILPNQPKMGPLFWQEFRPCFGGGYTYRLTPSKIFQDIGALGISYLTHALMYLLGNIHPGFTNINSPNGKKQQKIHMIPTCFRWFVALLPHGAVATQPKPALVVTMWRPWWDSPGKKKHCIPWDGLT